MPAAAVIPAPIAYIKVVAVKKLVVGFLVEAPSPALRGRVPGFPRAILVASVAPFTGRGTSSDFYFEKIRVFKAGLRFA